jgi:6-pyruvoyltetrahydropterin/6-carboxytetrahydropterin synthase
LAQATIAGFIDYHGGEAAQLLLATAVQGAQAMIVTAKLGFSAAHRLNNPARDAEWNRRVYDKCDNPAGHGHNYAIEVSVEGEIDPETGMVIDLKRLKEIVRRVIISRVDHTNLNSDVDFLRGVIPTAENLAVAFWRELAPAIDQGRLVEITLKETENNSAVYRGD